MKEFKITYTQYDVYEDEIIEYDTNIVARNSELALEEFYDNNKNVEEIINIELIGEVEDERFERTKFENSKLY